MLDAAFLVRVPRLRRGRQTFYHECNDVAQFDWRCRMTQMPVQLELDRHPYQTDFR
jgi:hypothetical protein